MQTLFRLIILHEAEAFFCLPSWRNGWRNQIWSAHVKTDRWCRQSELIVPQTAERSVSVSTPNMICSIRPLQTYKLNSEQHLGSSK